jgi:phosphoribosylformimino-5-aminoimidazole carboxamide ribotide isomerase
MTSYSADPAETARRWLRAGASWLHVVNLDGAFGERDAANQQALLSILNVANGFSAQVQFGGGLRSLDAIAHALKLGMPRLVIGTLAIEQPDVLANALTRFSAERLAVGIDARDGLVRMHGWKSNSGIRALDLAIQMRDLGVRSIIFTDVNRDGVGRGLNIEATRQLAEISGLDVIASGGVHTMGDVMAARNANLSGVIVGRAIYEGTLDLKASLQEVAHAGKKNHPVS